jgi:battenin
LPSPTQFDSVANASADYAPLLLNADVDDTRPEAGINEYAVPSKGTTVSLSIDDKWRLVKPLLMKYMLPLCK